MRYFFIRFFMYFFDELFKRFKEFEGLGDSFGNSWDWNVDLIFKFLMVDGGFVKLLVYIKVMCYLEFK